MPSITNEMLPLQQQMRFFMRQALSLAQTAASEGEVPVGAVIVCDGEVVGRGYNQVEKLKDPTAHAELIALTAACNTLGTKFLNGCTMYVTLEPCPMCAGALVWSRLDRLVFGAPDARAGACGSIMNIVQNSALNHRLEVIQGIMDVESEALLKEFFRDKRKNFE
jgi:tRNA(adenine34) deaminase